MLLNTDGRSRVYNTFACVCFALGVHVVVKMQANYCVVSGGGPSLVPRPFEGKAWGLLLAHARKIPFIFRIIRRKISDNDVIVHGESVRKEYADTFSTVTATIS